MLLDGRLAGPSTYSNAAWPIPSIFAGEMGQKTQAIFGWLNSLQFVLLKSTRYSVIVGDPPVNVQKGLEDWKTKHESRSCPRTAFAVEIPGVTQSCPFRPELVNVPFRGF